MNRDLDGNLELFKGILSSNLFFKVPSVNAEQIFARLQVINVSQGDAVIEEGDDGDCCYFLQHGEASIYKTIDGDDCLVAEIMPGRCFGEDALVDKKPRNASVVMKTDGVLLRLVKEDFLKLLSEPEVEELEWTDIEEMSYKPILIDIRTEAEYRLGHLAFSANIPMSILGMKKRVLALEQSYVLYCDTGRRSRAAAFFLGKLGYNVVSLAGGLQQQGLLDHLVTEPSYMLREGRLIRSDD
jgi:rhodanese-related sulfurtransferase